jgi:hypothetical protein
MSKRRGEEREEGKPKEKGIHGLQAAPSDGVDAQLIGLSITMVFWSFSKLWRETINIEIAN